MPYCLNRLEVVRVYEALKRLYDTGKLTEDMLQRALNEKSWITQEQYNDIINTNQEGSA